MSKPKLLLFIFSNYEEIKAKGLKNIYSSYLENGYFEKILCIFPFAKFKNDIYLKNKSVYIFQSGWLPKKFSRINFKFLKFIFLILFFPKILFEIYKKIKLFNPDIIRSTDPYLLGLFGIFFSKILKKPFIISIHSDYDLGDKLKGNTFKIFGSRQIPKKIEKYTLKQADRIFVLSEYSANRVKNENPEFSKKIRVAQHLFDFDTLNSSSSHSIRKEFKIHKNTKILSFVARLAQENFVFDLCDLAQSLNKKKFKDYIIIIFGDGELRQELLNLINQKNLQSYFIFAGFQPREKGIQLRKESFFSICFMGGMSLIESLACSTPAVCYDIEWHSELIINNKTGILAKEKDVNFISKSLLFYSKNQNELYKIKKNAYKKAYQKHNFKKLVIQKQEYYSEIINLCKKYKNEKKNAKQL
jgi:glycosyltransferase involved in cell wall biosynthesis